MGLSVLSGSVIFSELIFLTFLIVGVVICKKNSFTSGFYFFLIIIVNKILSYVAPFFMGKYFDSLILNDPLPMGMSFGEFFAFLHLSMNLILKLVELSAFLLLIMGLYKMWKTKDMNPSC